MRNVQNKPSQAEIKVNMKKQKQNTQQDLGNLRTDLCNCLVGEGCDILALLLCISVLLCISTNIYIHTLYLHHFIFVSP